MADDIFNITGISMYAKIKEPDQARVIKAKDGKEIVTDSKWTVDLLLNQKGKMVAERAGVRVRNAPSDPNLNYKYVEYVTTSGLLEKGYTGEYIRITKNAEKQARNEDGSPMYNGPIPVKAPANPPRIRDSKGTDIPLEDVPLIGNGSELQVAFTPTIAPGKKHGEYGARFISVKILELVEYDPEEGPKGTYEFSGTPEYAKAN